jgi:soluble lytic murein transglycosylase-like protein
MSLRSRAVGALALLAAVVGTSACSPETEALLGWLHDQGHAAEASGLPCPELAGDLAWRGLPPEFLDIIWRESRCDPTVVNASSGALGLTQIMPSWLAPLCEAGIACTRDDLLQPAANLDAARLIFDLQGWSAWSTNSG